MLAQNANANSAIINPHPNSAQHALGLVKHAMVLQPFAYHA